MSRKLIYVISFVLVLAVAGTAQAGLNDPPLLNPSFEEDGSWSAPTPGWYDYDPPTQSEWWAFQETRGTDPETPYGDVWGALRPGGVHWQKIGTWDAGMEYQIDVIVGNRATWTNSGVIISLWAGGDEALASDDTYLEEIGATMLSVSELLITDEVGSVVEVKEVSTILTTGIGHSPGDPLWIQIESGAGFVGDGEIAYFDNVRIKSLIVAKTGYAQYPDPAIETMLETLWYELHWKPGDFVDTHNLYISESFDDVNDGAVGAFAGNYSEPSLFVGFPGRPIPGGLVPGTTYYWRIDEVNDANSNSPWEGDVWSFYIQSDTAYEPSPVDSVNFVLQDVPLSWTAGLGADLHYLYFGDNFDAVNDAETGCQTLIDTAYTPDTLELGKTYYWRVDEFDNLGITHKGNVWSFTTVPDIAVTDPDLLGLWTLNEGEGTTAVDRSGHGGHGSFVGEPQWADGYQDMALQFGGTSDWVNCGDDTGDGVTADFTLAAWAQMTPGNAGSYMSIAGKLVSASGYRGFVLVRHSSNVFRLWLGDGTTTLSGTGSDATYTDTDWHHVAAVREGTINALYVDGVKQSTPTTTDFVPSELNFSIGKQYGQSDSRFWKGKIDDVQLYSKALTAEQIASMMLGNTKLAGSPMPDRDAVVDIRDISSLSFSAGDTAASHDVYLGTDRDAVAGATNDSPEFQGNQAGTSLSLAGLVEFGGGDYYWRIDEVEADGTAITGTIWKFTVPDNLIVDDFEAYDAGNNEIWWSWKDGLGYPARDGMPAYAGNGTGAAVGDEDSLTYMEMSIVNGGDKSMPFWYTNNQQGSAMYSEVELTLPAGSRDWTVEGVTELSLWFRGAADNIGEPLYVAISNAAGTPVVIYHDDPNAVQLVRYTEWVIPLQSLADQGIVLTNVDKISIGVGTRGNTTIPGGTGKMYIDDVALYRSRGE